MSHCLPGGLAVEPLQQTLQQNRALHRSTTQAHRHAADVELYSSTALQIYQSALHLYSSTALYTLHPLHPPSEPEGKLTFSSWGHLSALGFFPTDHSGNFYQMQKLHLTTRANSIAFYHSGKLDETGGRKTRFPRLAGEHAWSGRCAAAAHRWSLRRGPIH